MSRDIKLKPWKSNFKSPPKEWIKDRLETLHETLSKNTCSSALALKGLLGTIELEPISDENEDFYGLIEGLEVDKNGDSPLSDERKQTGTVPIFKPYYVAHTKIQTLALLDRGKGSNWSRWWTRSLPIRTTAEIRAHIKILPAKYPYLYQKLTQKATELHLLGLSYTKIAKILSINHKTVAKAIKRHNHCH